MKRLLIFLIGFSVASALGPIYLSRSSWIPKSSGGAKGGSMSTLTKPTFL